MRYSGVGLRPDVEPILGHEPVPRCQLFQSLDWIGLLCCLGQRDNHHIDLTLVIFHAQDHYHQDVDGYDNGALQRRLNPVANPDRHGQELQ